MKSFLSVAVVLALSAAVATSTTQGRPEGKPIQGPPPPDVKATHKTRAWEMTLAADAWLKTLDDELKAKLQFAFDAPERTAWGYVGPPDAGLALGEMSSEQRIAFDELLRTGLSASGYLRVYGVIQLEEILGRDPGVYRVMLFGDPGGEEAWAWKFEGHHVSLNFTLRRGKFVSATPFFLGADPAQVQEGTLAGYAMFQAEETRIREFMTGHRFTEAFPDAKVPGDIILNPDGPSMFTEVEGLPVGKLARPLQNDVVGLMTMFLGNLHNDLRFPMSNRYQYKALTDVFYQWAGSLTPGEAMYARIASPDKGFAVEYLNRGNHVHLVIRDTADDFGVKPIDAWKNH